MNAERRKYLDVLAAARRTHDATVMAAWRTFKADTADADARRTFYGATADARAAYAAALEEEVTP